MASNDTDPTLVGAAVSISPFLPDEILLEIFHHLTRVEHLIPLLTVCHDWRRVACDASLWHANCVGVIGMWPAVQAIRAAGSQNTLRLDVNTPVLAEEDLAWVAAQDRGLARFFASVRALTLDEWFERKHVEHFVNSVSTGLECLDLHWCAIDAEIMGTIGRNVPTLRELTTSAGFLNLTNEDEIAAVYAAFCIPQLEALTIEPYSYVQLTVTRLPKDYASNLRRVTIRGCTVTVPAGFFHRKRFPILQELNTETSQEGDPLGGDSLPRTGLKTQPPAVRAKTKVKTLTKTAPHAGGSRPRLGSASRTAVAAGGPKTRIRDSGAAAKTPTQHTATHTRGTTVSSSPSPPTMGVKAKATPRVAATTVRKKSTVKPPTNMNI